MAAFTGISSPRTISPRRAVGRALAGSGGKGGRPRLRRGLFCRLDARAALIKQYLSEAHRDASGSGCVLAALGSDARRQGRAIRRAFTEGLYFFLVDVLAKLAPSRSSSGRSASRRSQTWRRWSVRWCWRGPWTTWFSRRKSSMLAHRRSGALRMANRAHYNVGLNVFRPSG